VGVSSESIAGMWIRKLIENGRSCVKLWNHPYIGILLWLISFAVWAYWHPYSHLPTPGKAIGALAVVAGIMSVREMKELAKISWVVLLIMLLFTEFRAIDKDHYQAEQAQERFFDTQRKGFGDIAIQAKQNFDSTAAGLTIAINGLNRTLAQTHPHAELHYGAFTFTNGPVPPASFTSGVNYQIDVDYTNVGGEAGTLLREDAQVYVAKPDDRIAQQALVKLFEQTWRKLPASFSSLVNPGTPHFFTRYRTFTDKEIEAINAGETVYVLRRLQYRDSTGLWQTDDCGDFQREGRSLFIHIGHSCSLFVRDRYPVTRR
jgi:hypothetical protein